MPLRCRGRLSVAVVMTILWWDFPPASSPIISCRNGRVARCAAFQKVGGRFEEHHPSRCGVRTRILQSVPDCGGALPL